MDQAGSEISISGKDTLVRILQGKRLLYGFPCHIAEVFPQFRLEFEPAMPIGASFHECDAVGDEWNGLWVCHAAVVVKVVQHEAFRVPAHDGSDEAGLVQIIADQARMGCIPGRETLFLVVIGIL